MKLYERGNLIIRKKRVTNQKQAIAIALQQANANCKKHMKRVDIDNIETKVENIDPNSDLRYSDLNRILFLYNDYKEKKSNVKLIQIQHTLITYLLKYPQNQRFIKMISRIIK